MWWALQLALDVETCRRLLLGVPVDPASLDPKVLAPHLMTGLDPEFPKKVQPGDIIVAGRRFAQGNPHIQGLIGIRAHQLGLVVESMQRGSFRNAINAGVDVVGPLYAARTVAGEKFRAMVEADGLGAALKARTDQFKE